MRRSIAALAAASLSFSFADCAPIDARRQAAVAHELKATNKTVHWGYFSKKVAPALTIKSGDTVKVEMVSHHAGDNPGLMITGDKAIEEIFKWGPTGPGTTHETAMRGMTGSGDGVHVLTGPIFVETAEPGDVLKVEILKLYPRLNPQGETYGVNAAAWWGFHYGINGGMEGKASLLGLKTGDNKNREITNIYKAVLDPADKTIVKHVIPHSQSQYGQNKTVVTDCLNGRTGFSPGVTVPCVDGKQTWTGYYFPGLLTDTSKITFDTSIKGKFKVPVNMHVGCMGLAPSEVDYADSVPPMPYGGNLDDRRIGMGATMYYPVAVKGALLSMGDAHLAQGDGELDGTAIETHITGEFKISVIKADSIKSDDTSTNHLKSLSYPLLENANEYVIHGFSYNNYLTELKYDNQTFKNSAEFGLGIYGKSSVDRAVGNAMNNGKTFLMNKGYSEDVAITMMSVAGDFGITQVVDGNWGAHVTIPKWVINGNSEDVYYPSVFDGYSTRIPPCTFLTGQGVCLKSAGARTGVPVISALLLASFALFNAIF